MSDSDDESGDESGDEFVRPVHMSGLASDSVAALSVELGDADARQIEDDDVGSSSASSPSAADAFEEDIAASNAAPSSNAYAVTAPYCQSTFIELVAAVR